MNTYFYKISDESKESLINKDQRRLQGGAMGAQPLPLEKWMLFYGGVSQPPVAIGLRND